MAARTLARGGQPLLALARFEAWRSFRHPLTWTGVLLSLLLMWRYVGTQAPVLLRDTVLLGGFLLPIAAATLLIWFQTTARTRRLGELAVALPMNRNRIVLGSQLALAAPMLLTVVVEAGALVYLLVGEPIGRIPVWEAVTPPIITALGGMGGILLGRYLPHPLTAPLAVIGLAAIQFIAAPDRQLGYETPTNNFEWLAPWMPPDAFKPVVVQLGRPSALHFAYLIALVLMLGLVARHTTRAGNTARLVAASVFLGIVIGLSTSVVPVDQDVYRHWQDAAGNQTCITAQGIEYCALPLYDDWIPRWQATVRAVDELVPVQLGAVYQRPHNTGWDDNSGVPSDRVVVLTTMEWDRPGAPPEQAFALAEEAARSAVGLPPGPVKRFLTEDEIEELVRNNPGSNADTFRGSETYVSCSSIGQARAVVAFWAAGIANPGAARMIDTSLDQFLETPTFVHRDPVHLSGTFTGRSDAQMARQLLDVPPSEVQRAIGENWLAIADGSMSSSELANLFGLDPIPESQPDFEAAPCR